VVRGFVTCLGEREIVMAGAWDSEYFEREKPSAAGPVPVQASPGVQDTPPPMYNVAKQGGSGSKLVTLLLLAFRTLTFVFGLIGLAILAADKTTYDFEYEGADYQYDVKFTIFAAYK
jgi:hypothetical protein